MYNVYVLISLKDYKFYIGFSENLEQRVKDHNFGSNKSTKNRRPFKLIYSEAHLSKIDALKRERYFKTAKGKTTLKLMLKTAISNVFSEQS